MHQAVKIAQDDSRGLGLVASEEIPRGTDLIVLPEHVPLRFRSLESDHEDGLDSVLVNLARRIPGIDSSFGFYAIFIFESYLGFNLFGRHVLCSINVRLLFD